MGFKPDFRGNPKTTAFQILHYTREDLELIKRAVNARMKQLIQEEADSFKVRDRVVFTHKGETIMGTVVKVNRKTISIRSDNDVPWRVSPKFLSLET